MCILDGNKNDFGSYDVVMSVHKLTVILLYVLKEARKDFQLCARDVRVMH